MNQALWASASGCGGCGLNRRSFLQGCVACAAGGTGLLASHGQQVAAAETARPKIRLVFSQVPMPQPTWPYIGFDFEPRKREVIELLKKGCPKGASNPYHIRNNAEPRAGSTARSIMPLGYMTTSVEFNAFRKEVLFHQGKTVANDETDRACRNKLAVEVKGDIEKLLCQWDQWGWHRVTFFGDLKEPVQELAMALRMKVVEEA